MKRIITTLSIIITGGATLAAPPDSTAYNESFDPIYNPGEAFEEDKIMQRFNPIYGNEKETNKIIEFIARNLVVALSPAQLKQLDGYLVIGFEIDTKGSIGRLKVVRSYNSWVDYAILGAMAELPNWGTPSYDNGVAVERYHQIVFTFGSYIKGNATYGFQGNTVNQNTQNELNRQREEYYAKIKEEKEKWQDFSDVNSRLEYDIQDGLKQDAPIVEDIDPFDPNNLPPTAPTISITEL